MSRKRASRRLSPAVSSAEAFHLSPQRSGRTVSAPVSIDGQEYLGATIQDTGPRFERHPIWGNTLASHAIVISTPEIVENVPKRWENFEVEVSAPGLLYSRCQLTGLYWSRYDGMRVHFRVLGGAHVK